MITNQRWGARYPKLGTVRGRVAVLAAVVCLVATGSLYAQSSGGLTIAGVMDGGPAAKAGIASGDVLVQLDGKAIASREDVRTIMQAHQAGDTVPVVVLHGGQQLSVNLTLVAGRRGVPTTGMFFPRPANSQTAG